MSDRITRETSELRLGVGDVHVFIRIRALLRRLKYRKLYAFEYRQRPRGVWATKITVGAIRSVRLPQYKYIVTD